MFGTTKPFVIITLFSLCAHSSHLGKEVKQERNLRGRKKKEKTKTTRKREEGKKRKKSGE